MTETAYEYVRRLLSDHEPHCGHPRCGLRVFAPAIANRGDIKTAEHIVFWCEDHGHWVGDETEVLWKRRKLPSVE